MTGGMQISRVSRALVCAASQIRADIPRYPPLIGEVRTAGLVDGALGEHRSLPETE